MHERASATETVHPPTTEAPAALMRQLRHAARIPDSDPRWPPFCTQLVTFCDAVKTWCQSADCPRDLQEAYETRDLDKLLSALIAYLDEQLSDQVNVILHHQDFQQLEATWRGLYYLVDRTETSPLLRIEVFDATKDELRRNLEKAGRKIQKTKLYQELMPKRFTRPGGKPFSLLLADYRVNHLSPDVSLLKRTAPIVATAHVPILFGAEPTLLGLEDFRQLEEPFDVAQRFAAQEYIEWRALRAVLDSPYVGVVLPQFLLRRPYGPTTNPVDGLTFHEDVEGRDARKYLWGNSVFALAACVTNALYWYGEAAAIRGAQGGGRVVDLPLPPTFNTGPGAHEAKCATEVFIDGELQSALTKAGLITLSAYEDADYAVFFNIPSIHLPATYDTPGANASAFLTAQIPYLMAVSRVVHCLNAMLLEYIGMAIERDEIERLLNRWLLGYTNNSPNASQDLKSRYPFKDARIDLQDVPGKPGTYTAIAYLRPHFQLEGIAVTVHLVAEVPQTVKS
jgi:type VI secretion system protein ImpC